MRGCVSYKIRYTRCVLRATIYIFPVTCHHVALPVFESLCTEASFFLVCVSYSSGRVSTMGQQSQRAHLAPLSPWLQPKSLKRTKALKVSRKQAQRKAVGRELMGCIYTRSACKTKATLRLDTCWEAKPGQSNIICNNRVCGWKYSDYYMLDLIWTEMNE